MKQKLLYLSTIILVTNLLVSCGGIVTSMANKKLTVKNGAIPPDFNKDNGTMLFVTYRRGYNKYLKKNVANLYTGAHEFVTKDELASNLYTDIDKYRFVFDYDIISTTEFGFDGKMKTRNIRKFYVYDRKKERKFRSKMTSGFWSKLQKVYLKKLNEKK